MLTFKEYIVESSGKKLLHLEHLEDEILNSGKVGANSILYFLSSLVEMLSGNHNSNAVITTKWDGAPAVAAGQDPETGKFFVAYKSMKKLCFTQDDVRENFEGKGELINIYSSLLEHLSKVNIKGIVMQGDVLWSSPSGLKEQTIDGTTYVTFTPNTITYAVPKDSDLGKRIQKSKIGIVFHTSFPIQGAKNVDDLSANFGADISGLKNHKDVFVTDSEFKDVSAKATFSKADTTKINGIIEEINKVLNTIDANFLSNITSNEKLKIDIKAYINTLVRKGEFIDDSQKNQNDLVEYLKTKYSKEVLKLKTEAGRQKKQQSFDKVVTHISSNSAQLKKIFKIMALVNNAKVHIIRKLEEVKSLTHTFMKTENGFKVTKPEGFVAIDRNDKTIGIKLVDRMEFSMNNFNAAKNWDK